MPSLAPSHRFVDKGLTSTPSQPHLLLLTLLLSSQYSEDLSKVFRRKTRTVDCGPVKVRHNKREEGKVGRVCCSYDGNIPISMVVMICDLQYGDMRND